MLATLVQRHDPFVVSGHECDPVLLKDVSDPARRSVGRRAKRKDGFGSGYFGLVTDSVVEELAHSVTHPIQRSSYVGEAFCLNEHLLCTALNEKIDVVVIPALTPEPLRRSPNQF